jgi:hypothetical protein
VVLVFVFVFVLWFLPVFCQLIDSLLLIISG